MSAIDNVISGRTGRVNPVSNVAGLVCLMVPPLASFDPWTPLLTLAFGLTIFLSLARPNVKNWFRLAAPFFVLSLGLGLINLLFTDPRGSQVRYLLGPFTVSDYSIGRALSIAARSLTLTALCTIAANSMSAIGFVRALMQQLKLNPIAGYSLFAGFNALPQFGEDIANMDRIRLLRAAGRKRPLSERFALPVILLASAIRRAERTSLSMASRGLENAKKRSFVLVSELRVRDWIFAGLCGAASVTALVVSANLGWFSFNLG